MDFLIERIYFYFPALDTSIAESIKKLLNQDLKKIRDSEKPMSGLKKFLDEMVKSYESSLAKIKRSIEKTEGMLLALIDIGDLFYASDYESYCLFSSYVSSEQISEIVKRWKEDYRSRFDKKSHIFWGSADFFEEFDAISHYRFMEIFNIMDFSETMIEIEDMVKETIKESRLVLFLACRSPLLCSRLGTYIDDALRLVIESQNKDAGWWPDVSEFPEKPDFYYTTISCSILLKLSKQKDLQDQINKAINWLVKEQRQDGSWSSNWRSEFDEDATLISTLLAVKIIKSSGIQGYEYTLSLAEKWIMDQQQPGGYWNSSIPFIDCLIVECLKDIKSDPQMRASFEKKEIPQNIGLKDSMTDTSQKSNILIVTVTEIESRAVLKVFEEETGNKPQPIPISDRFYHDLGKVSGRNIFLAISEMGTSGPGASQQAVAEGIKALNPSAVIMVGIAFGMDEKKQEIGDILVSKQLLLYDSQRVGEERIPRGDKPHASSNLINRLTSAQLYWNGCAKVRFGLLLTADKLIDNIEFRDKLKALEPEAIGGEMEGGGLYTACCEAHVDWIIVKAICDWADGKKYQDKNKHQLLAAENAAKFVLFSLRLDD